MAKYQGAEFDLCPPCSATWMAWLDYKMPPAPIRLDGTGIRTVRDIQAAQERRFQEWRETVRFEQDLTVKICAERHHGMTQPALTEQAK